MESLKSPKPKKAWQVKSQEYVIICLYIKGIANKQFVLRGQTVNLEYYC
jgi:hypothetical protein